MTGAHRPDQEAKATRVLACNRCYRRKIKCNKIFPCSNCLEVGSPCITAATRKNEGRRHLAKQDLLQRLQRYEMLLEQNRIPFDSSQQGVLSPSSPLSDVRCEVASAPIPPNNKQASGSQPSEKLNIWQAPNEQTNENHSNATDNMNEPDFSKGSFTNDQSMQRAMDRLHKDKNDDLLFFASNPDFDLTAQHPPPGQLLKLWQVYQDNIDPLLKVTHTPTLQARITDAVGRMDKIPAALEALLFSIYSVALESLTDDESATNFAPAYSRSQLLNKYQIACQHALIRCGYLRSDDRDCLTALYLYMISIKPSVDRRSLCSILGSVFRIAQRMELHNESRNAKCGIFEAEMRRRLWWSLVLFDAHICEMSNNLQSANLLPTWDCKPPSNINDFELRPDMKSHPPTSLVPNQALYVAVRSLIVQYLRHSDFQLVFINPILEHFGHQGPASALLTDGDETAMLEKLLGVHISKHLDLDNPLHCMTIWTARGQIAKVRLLQHYWTQSRRTKPAATEQTAATNTTTNALDAATTSALRILEYEAQLTTLPHLHGFAWHISRIYFPAYVHILKDLQKRPRQACAERAWEVMSANFHARLEENPARENAVMSLFANLVLRAWEEREKEHVLEWRAVYGSCPRIVEDVRRFLPSTESERSDVAASWDFSLDDLLPVPMECSDQHLQDGASFNSLLGDFDLSVFGNESSSL